MLQPEAFKIMNEIEKPYVMLNLIFWLRKTCEDEQNTFLKQVAFS